jgi:hypothetical protein
MTYTPTESRPCEVCGATHHYDCPNLGPVSFLEAVMHDPTAAMRHRIRAAEILQGLMAKGIYSDDLGEPAPTIRYQIGGMPLQ